ncbi:MAG TPA: hypothetical protein VEA37_03290 [Flavobacterium sp.]|nr:hypothetical protein [Flavobacterium sp.]
MALKVKDLIKKLKKFDGDLPVYIADHDHATFETNGQAYSVHIVDQKNMDKAAKARQKEFYKIEGEYIIISVG